MESIHFCIMPVSASVALTLESMACASAWMTILLCLQSFAFSDHSKSRSACRALFHTARRFSFSASAWRKRERRFAFSSFSKARRFVHRSWSACRASFSRERRFACSDRSKSRSARNFLFPLCLLLGAACEVEAPPLSTGSARQDEHAKGLYRRIALLPRPRLSPMMQPVRVASLSQPKKTLSCRCRSHQRKQRLRHRCVCLLLLQSCSRGGEEESGRHVL
jgi:hypothetical protein